MKKKKPKGSRLSAQVLACKDRITRLEAELLEAQLLIERLQGENVTAKRVLAMAQYLLRVAGQFDAEAKKLLGL